MKTRAFGTAGKHAGDDYSSYGLSSGPHFVIVDLGCGYYETRTRADVFAVCRAIHAPKTPMGTLFHDCARIAKAAEAALAARCRPQEEAS